MIEVVALVKGIHNYDHSRRLKMPAQLLNRAHNELMKLVFCRFFVNGRICLDLRSDEGRHRGKTANKLSSYRGEEECRTTTVAFAPLEEETGSKHAIVGECLGYCSRDCRLAGAGHTV